MALAAVDLGREDGSRLVEGARVADDLACLWPQTGVADRMDGSPRCHSHSRLRVHVGEGERERNRGDQQHDEHYSHDHQRERGDGVDAGAARL